MSPDPFHRTSPIEFCEVEKVFTHFARDAAERVSTWPSDLHEVTVVRLGNEPITVTELVPVEPAEARALRGAELLRFVQTAFTDRPASAVAVVQVAPAEGGGLSIAVHTREGVHVGQLSHDGTATPPVEPAG